MEMFGRKGKREEKGKREKKGKRKNNIKTSIIVFVVVFACLFLFRFYCVHASNSIQFNGNFQFFFMNKDQCSELFIFSLKL